MSLRWRVCVVAQLARGSVIGADSGRLRLQAAEGARGGWLVTGG
jgi:hypothetical protein